MFKLSDIKAGYLLRCTQLKEGRVFNMTVIPCRRGLPLPLAIFDAIQTKDGDLAGCNPGKDWVPLAGFGSDLIHANTYRIDEVWGHASPMRLMDNTTEGRERLWQRDDTKRMTLTEIEKALGYKVKVVKAGEPVPGLFKKSSMYAGMVVELREGSKRLVVPSGEGLLLVGEPARVLGTVATYRRPVLRLADYIDGLTRKREGTEPTDIVKVWDRIPYACHVDNAFTTNTEVRKLLWQRDDTKRMTVEEIGKALGHKVEVVECVTTK
ncbi:MAG: hypothetical protein J6Q14_00540 [Oscillospiraceae bacterium]|nr:hypothetical protein [Oscillospiraceae bacterium]